MSHAAGKLAVGVDSWGRQRWTKNETGNRYGRLTVLRLHSKKAPPRGGSLRWRCRCACGKTAIVGGAQLRCGQTTSCGCYWNEIRKAGCRKLPVNEAAFNRAYGKVRDGAIKRHLGWEITKENARSLLSAPCHYCGSKPVLMQTGKYGSFIWNGLDQKEPCGGYTLDNCVPCCTECNRMKMAIPYGAFIEKIKRIASRFDDIDPLAKQSESMKRMR